MIFSLTANTIRGYNNQLLQSVFTVKPWSSESLLLEYGRQFYFRGITLFEFKLNWYQTSYTLYSNIQPVNFLLGIKTSFLQVFSYRIRYIWSTEGCGVSVRNQSKIVGLNTFSFHTLSSFDSLKQNYLLFGFSFYWSVVVTTLNPTLVMRLWPLNQVFKKTKTIAQKLLFLIRGPSGK